MQICDNIAVNEKGILTFRGFDTEELAKKYKTPLYLLDEEKIREKMRAYKTAMKKYFGDNSFPLYASKAASFKRIYEIAKEEEIGVDVVSAGELYTAFLAGFPTENIFFHGNNKTIDEIAFAMDKKIGYFVADSEVELARIDKEAEKRGIKQKILLRITPGIDAHTNQKIATGNVDSKFGMAIETGDAEGFVKTALSYKNTELLGYHCHIGSQVFDSSVFNDGIDIMMDFAKDIKEKLGYEPEILNLGGGFGVRYTADDPELDIEKTIREVAQTLNKKCGTLGMKRPQMIMEPGRSIVADAGMTLYTVGTVKEISGFKNYVAIDGGMADNPRFALYEAKYTAVNASRATNAADYKASVVGKCCESGDVIGEDMMMAKPRVDDILAILTTGAYNYSMSSNYNRLLKPAVVMLSKDKDYLAVKRETYEDLVRNDL